MPYTIRREKDGTFSLLNSQTGKKHSSHTTEEKAKSQKRLLLAVEHGWKPTGKKG